MDGCTLVSDKAAGLALSQVTLLPLDKLQNAAFSSTLTGLSCLVNVTFMPSQPTHGAVSHVGSLEPSTGW